MSNNNSAADERYTNTSPKPLYYSSDHPSLYCYRPQTKLGQGNVFSCVCHSVYRGSWPPSMHHRLQDQHPGGVGFLVCITCHMTSIWGGGGGLHPGGLGRPPSGTRKAGGTHPTGILSCSSDHPPLYHSSDHPPLSSTKVYTHRASTEIMF